MGRPDLNKQRRRENLREELQAREYLRQLDLVDQEVTANWKTLSSENVSALRLKVDLNFKRLNKVLPDIKAVELSGPDGGDIPLNGTVKIVRSSD